MGLALNALRIKSELYYKLITLGVALIFVFVTVVANTALFADLAKANGEDSDPVAVIDTLQAFDAGRPFEDNIGWASSTRVVAQAFTTGEAGGQITEFVFQDYYTNSAHNGFNVKIYGSDVDGKINTEDEVASFGSSSTQGVSASFRVLVPDGEYNLESETRYWVAVTMSSGDVVWRQTNVDNNIGVGSIPDSAPSRALSTNSGSSFTYNDQGASYHATYSDPAYHFDFRLSMIPNEESEFNPGSLSVTTGDPTMDSITKTTATLNGAATLEGISWEELGDIVELEMSAPAFLTGTSSHAEDDSFAEPALVSEEDMNDYMEELLTKYSVFEPAGNTTEIDPQNISFSLDLESLECGTTYYYRAAMVFAALQEDTMQGAIVFGDEKSFTTLDCDTQNKVIYTNPVTNKQVTLEVDEVCDIETVSSVAESENTKQDEEFDYKDGLINFTINCPESHTATITQSYYGVTKENLVVRKHNSNTQEYFTIHEASIDQRIEENQPVTVVTYQVADNGYLDLDNALGVIKDPVGLASSIESESANSELAQTGMNVALLSMLTVVFSITSFVVLSKVRQN